MGQTTSFRYRIEMLIQQRIEDLVRHAQRLEYRNLDSSYTYKITQQFALDMDNPYLQLITLNKINQEDIMAITRNRDGDHEDKKPMQTESAQYLAKNASVDELLDERNALKKAGLCHEKVDMALQLKYK